MAKPTENPDVIEEGTGKAKRGSWKGKIRYHGKTVEVRIFKLEKTALMARQRIYYKDPKGLLCTKERVDAVTKKYTPMTDIWRNEAGDEVSASDLSTFTKINGVETRVQPFEKTDMITLDKEITPAQSAELLTAEQYEIIPDSEDDIPVLYEIAKEMSDKKVCAAGTIIFRHGFIKLGCVCEPRIDETKKEFGVFLKTVADRVVMKTPLMIPSGKPIPKEPAGVLSVADPFAGL